MSDTLELENIEELLTNPPKNTDIDFIYTNHDREPAWYRTLKGAYDMPITWWTGIIHSLMLTGAWGDQYKGAAQINQQRLDLILETLWVHPDRMKIIATCAAVASYNKAYLAGRFLIGGGFVTYSTNRLLKRFKFVQKYRVTTGLSQAAFNIGMASFGAGLLATALGYNSPKDVVYSILTGTAQRFPLSAPLIDIGLAELKDRAEKNIQDPEKLILIVEALNDIQPDTTKSYSQWCKDNPEQAASAYFCK